MRKFLTAILLLLFIVSAAAAETRECLLSFAGDTTLGGDTGSGARFMKRAQEKGLSYFLENVRPLFEEDDFTVVNLEGPLTDSRSPKRGKDFTFRGSPEYAKILSAGGVDAASLANNHAYDYKEEGAQDTRKALDAEGLKYYGYDDTLVAEPGGVRVGFVAMTEPYTKLSEVVDLISFLRPNCDVVVLSMHWGRELRKTPTKAQKKYAYAAINAGADLVIGHHPHVVEGVEIYKGRAIAYSLGNFCFGGNTNPVDKDCLIFRQRFSVSEAGEMTPGAIELIPCRISSTTQTNDYKPTPLEGKEAVALLKRVKKCSAGFSKTLDFEALAEKYAQAEKKK